MAGGIGCRHGIASDFFNGCGHFIDRRRCLFDFVVLLLQAVCAVERHRVEFISSARQLRGRTADALQRFPQVLLHGRERLEQSADFIVTVGFDRPGQVARATLSAALTALLSGRTMLRVSNIASATVASAASAMNRLTMVREVW